MDLELVALHYSESVLNAFIKQQRLFGMIPSTFYCAQNGHFPELPYKLVFDLQVFIKVCKYFADGHHLQI